MMRPVRTGGTIRYTSTHTGRRVLVEQIKLLVVLTVTGCLLVALETTPGARLQLPFFSRSPASPAWGLLFSMAVGFLYGEREGGVSGLFAGWLADAAGSGGIMLLPLLYFLCGYLSGVVGKRRLAHNLPSFAVFAVAGGGISCLFSIAKATVIGGRFPPLSWIGRGLIPVWILTILFSPLVYGIMWIERRLLHASE